jgi:sugar phosphate isomerase/epimerase
MTRTTLLWRITPHAYLWRLGRSDQADDREQTVPPFLLEGVRDAETAGYDGIECDVSWVADQRRAVAFAEQLDRRGLVLDAVFAGVLSTSPTGHLATVVAQCLAGRTLGYRFVNLVSRAITMGSAARSTPDDGAPEDIARIASFLVERLRPYGLDVCWHPHAGSLANGAAAVERVLAIAGERAPGLCLDLGWAVRAGADPATLLRRFAGQVRTLHVRDVTPTMQWCQAVGEGVLNLGAVSAALLAAGFDGATAVEYHLEERVEGARTLRDNAAYSLRAMRSHQAWRPTSAAERP